MDAREVYYFFPGIAYSFLTYQFNSIQFITVILLFFVSPLGDGLSRQAFLKPWADNFLFSQNNTRDPRTHLF